jgi:hypothetical protein
VETAVFEEPSRCLDDDRPAGCRATIRKPSNLNFVDPAGAGRRAISRRWQAGTHVHAGVIASRKEEGPPEGRRPFHRLAKVEPSSFLGAGEGAEARRKSNRSSWTPFRVARKKICLSVRYRTNGRRCAASPLMGLRRSQFVLSKFAVREMRHACSRSQVSASTHVSTLSFTRNPLR